MPASALSIALAGLFALAVQVGQAVVVLVVLMIQVLVALAPAPADERGRLVHAPRFEAALLSGLVATALTVWPGLLVGRSGVGVGVVGSIAALIPAAAVGVVVALVSQMLRRDDRRALVSSTGYAVSLAVFAALPVGWLTAAQGLAGAQVVTVCAAAVAAAMAAWLVPIDRWRSAGLAVAAGAVGGAIVAALAAGALSWLFGLVVGAVVGGFAVLGRVLGGAWGLGRRHAAAGWGLPGALALVVAAPVVHVAGLFAGAL